MENLIISVEDSPDDILILSTAFRKAKIAARLEFLTDGEQATEYFSNLSSNAVPTLLLLDMKLPKRSGLEILAWLRSEPTLKRLPIIMLSSSNQPEDINQAYDLGANSYLVKPGSIDELVELAHAIENYWLRANTKPDLNPVHFHPELRASFACET